MNDLLMNISDLKVTIDEISSAFYQQNEKQGYQMFEKSYPALIQIIDILLLMDDESKITEKEKGLISDYLMAALQALENKDTVLLADVLKYDVMELLSGVGRKL